MSWVFWIIAWVIACVIAAIAYGFLAPLKVHFTTRLPLAEKGDWIGPAQDAPFIGLALSGSGARAPIFAAAGIEALQRRGLLSGVTHVSSVSGGGFAASYLALHPVPADATDTYFNKMRHVLSHGYFWDTQMGQLRNPSRLFSPSRRFQSLQEALDRPDFLRNTTSTDLPTDRRFCFNTVSYDSGHRFVFSNTVLPRIDDMDVSDLPISLRSLSFTDTAGHLKTPGSVPVSLAVATSAAFPPYLGPMTIEVKDHQELELQYWHLGDGGVLENQGVETLREAVYAQKPRAPAIIYSFDAGQELNRDLSRNTLDISVWSRNMTRLVDALSVCAAPKRNTHYAAVDARTGTQIDLMTFNYMDVVRLARSENPPDPKWLSWSERRCDNAKDRLESRSPADHLAKIPTALKITRCHRELISEAAHFLVNQRFPLRTVPS
jgi:predicted acylesterase/phospholipase RssA